MTIADRWLLPDGVDEVLLIIFIALRHIPADIAQRQRVLQVEV